MTKAVSPAGEWREARRRSAREAIVAAAWELVRANGLAGLSIRDLAKQAGITTPTIYMYFDSKNAIYDAMFGMAATEFANSMTEPYVSESHRDVQAEGVRRFIEFCTADPARYQLLFQRAIPGFEPSAESYAPAMRALGAVRERLAASGVRDPRWLDLWTALTTGLVDQQISNDPGGTRWSDLVDDAVDMFLTYCRSDTKRRDLAKARPLPGPPRKGRVSTRRG
jgi:AcrR family transcriptional regulator